MSQGSNSAGDVLKRCWMAIAFTQPVSKQRRCDTVRLEELGDVMPFVVHRVPGVSATGADDDCGARIDGAIGLVDEDAGLVCFLGTYGSRCSVWP